MEWASCPLHSQTPMLVEWASCPLHSQTPMLVEWASCPFEYCWRGQDARSTPIHSLTDATPAEK
ncbi:MAG: hypothetical protein F6K44_20215 [Moorea sp. SIO3E2]|uniref:hypothetical protein n=1 Tax=Moorena sp. SIO4E2 TaxID=2607826 RepID=UPI0013BCF03E|nr:hypothetical protein [Moorena sp. SIO4E2]NEP30258.1 hypothetical protein [Moorena sp. SIO3B2]NEQ10711.1 hypothetical protein [Moorena sp. SIO4E2]NEQ16001.1 hypothetical protein [Moorena sp. SIO3E2]